VEYCPLAAGTSRDLHHFFVEPRVSRHYTKDQAREILLESTPESRAAMFSLARFRALRIGFIAQILLFSLATSSASKNPAHASEPPQAQASLGPRQLLRVGDPHAHGIKDADLEALRTVLRGAVEDKTVPGVSLLLAHGGEIVFREAFGNLAVDQKVLMASSSKPVTATVLMILADRKKLDLDDPIEKYLPEFKTITLKGKPPKNPPTIRHLLCNMSGLPGDFLSESLLRRVRNGAAAGNGQDDAKGKGDPGFGLMSRRNRSLAESVRAQAEAGLATEPGAEFHYCSLGFNVAARVAEVAAKQPFEELARTELLEPLGMKDSRYLGIGLQALSTRATLSNGESRFIMAGGGMTSTLDDFAAFYQMNSNRGTYLGKRILSAQAVRTMHTRQTGIGLVMPLPYGNDYGLSFFLDRLDGQNEGRLVSHPGLFGTTPWLDKDRDLIAVFLVQSNFVRVMVLLRSVQAKTRAMFPVNPKP
jgi:CubicO group peptidase (beta-lactamase class C family)